MGCNENENFLLKSIKSNPLVWITTFFSSVLLGLNVWLTLRLVPVEKTQDNLNSRIEAIEHRNENLDPLIERFYKVEEKQVTFDQNVKDIKDTQSNMDKKIDKLLDLHLK